MIYIEYVDRKCGFRLTEFPSWDVPSCCELGSGAPKIGEELRAELEDADVVPFSDEENSLSFFHPPHS